MQPAAAPVSVPRPPLLFQTLVRSLYTHNPFYLLSAFLILYGLHVSFRPEAGQLINPWALMGALCGYALLLALTAFLIVRLGKVWEDARSLVLVLLLVLLAVSVSFDEIVNTSREQGYGLMLCGLGFSTLLSEALLRGLSLRLPALFRGPYYAILALFFVYPLFVSPEVTELPAATIDFRILLFPPAAAVVFLSLIPAIRRGAAYVSQVGTPWRWPWLPWAAFGFLALGVCLRSYSLSFSFSPARGMESTFGLYYLVPFLLALLVLALEIGVVEKIRAVQTIAACLAPGLLLLAIPGDGGSGPYRAFLTALVARAGSPIFFTVLGLALFYAYGWLRGMRGSESGLIAALLVACVVDRRTIDLRSLTFAHWWPLVVLGALQLGLGFRRKSSPRVFAGVLCCVASSSFALRETAYMAHAGVIPVHLTLLATLAIGLAFRDRFALILRRCGAATLPLLCLAAAGWPGATISPALRLGYILALTLLTFGYWRLIRDRWFLIAGGVSSASLVLASLSSLQGAWTRSVGARGFQPLVWGGACFALAALISAVKGFRWRRGIEESERSAGHGPS